MGICPAILMAPNIILPPSILGPCDNVVFFKLYYFIESSSINFIISLSSFSPVSMQQHPIQMCITSVVNGCTELLQAHWGTIHHSQLSTPTSFKTSHHPSALIRPQTKSTQQD